MDSEDEIVEVQRLIVYRGPRKWVRKVLQEGHLPPIGIFQPSPRQRITSSVGGHSIAKEAAKGWAYGRKAEDFMLQNVRGLPDES